MIDIILSSLGIGLVALYLLTHGDVLMVMNVHSIRMAILHEKRWLHLYPGTLLGSVSAGWDLAYGRELGGLQHIFLGLAGFAVFYELLGLPGIFKPIYYPDFVPLSEVSGKLNDYLDDELLAVSVGDTTRIYPIRPLRMNHIVNDDIAGEKLAITHCALCKTSIVYSRVVNGREIELIPTTSTNESNLIMKDNEGNFWQQISGEGLGPGNRGDNLRSLESMVITRDRAEDLHASGRDVQVMDYIHQGRRKFAAGPFDALMRLVDNPKRRVLFPVSHWDNRLPRKENIAGFSIGESFYAIPVGKDQRVEREIVLDGKPVSLSFDRRTGENRVIGKQTGEETNVIFPVYWFAWSTRYRDTTILELN